MHSLNMVVKISRQMPQQTLQLHLAEQRRTSTLHTFGYDSDDEDETGGITDEDAQYAAAHPTPALARLCLLPSITIISVRS